MIADFMRTDSPDGGRFRDRMRQAEADFWTEFTGVQAQMISILEQAQQSHQDDWDDTLFAAAKQLARAKGDLMNVVQTLKEGV